jgi:hypothetical protein
MDKDGVVHLYNVPDARHNLVLKEGWVRFRLGANYEQYDPLIRKAAEKYGVDYALVKAVIKGGIKLQSQRGLPEGGQRLDAAYAGDSRRSRGHGVFSA